MRLFPVFADFLRFDREYKSNLSKEVEKRWVRIRRLENDRDSNKFIIDGDYEVSCYQVQRKKKDEREKVQKVSETKRTQRFYIY